MKKILFVIVTIFTMIGFAGCEQNITVTEANIIGKWQLISVQEGNQIYTQKDLGDEVWEFTADHKWYQTDVFGLENSGSWSLNGNQLTIGYFSSPATVTMSSITTLTLSATHEGDRVKFSFKKIK